VLGKDCAAKRGNISCKRTSASPLYLLFQGNHTKPNPAADPNMEIDRFSVSDPRVPMRAEAESLVENIKQSMGLLRRHL
jgi:hypothetical protein